MNKERPTTNERLSIPNYRLRRLVGATLAATGVFAAGVGVGTQVDSSPRTATEKVYCAEDTSSGWGDTMIDTAGRAFDKALEDAASHDTRTETYLDILDMNHESKKHIANTYALNNEVVLREGVTAPQEGENDVVEVCVDGLGIDSMTVSSSNDSHGK